MAKDTGEIHYGTIEKVIYDPTKNATQEGYEVSIVLHNTAGSFRVTEETFWDKGYPGGFNPGDIVKFISYDDLVIKFLETEKKVEEPPVKKSTCIWDNL